MPGRECYHCKQWIDNDVEHDCWTTTEAALTRDLPDDLREAWLRLRETAAALGEQRIYASHNSIMFARKACYFFVRPRSTSLEICIFLGRALKAPQVRRTMPASKVKLAHIVHVRHRDEVEAPLTDWIAEAYEVSDTLRATRTAKRSATASQRAGPRRRSETPSPKKRPHRPTPMN